MTWTGIFESLISDILFLVLAVVVGWLWITFTQRKKLLDFFHASKAKRIVIYLSNIRVLPFGAVGISGVKMSFEGDAVAYGEMLAANRLRSLFSFVVPALADASETIGRVFLSDTRVETKVSPVNLGDIDKVAPIITLGSSAYNIVSNYIEKSEKGAVVFRPGAMTTADLKKSSASPGTIALSSSDPQPHDPSPFPYWSAALPGYSIPSPSGTYSRDDMMSAGLPQEIHQGPSELIVQGIPPITDTTYGFVERVFDKGGRALFYVGGLSEYATKGAAFYLANSWKALYEKYKEDKPFLVVLKVSTDDYNACSLVLERELTG